MRVPVEPATALGPVDEALLAAAPDAEVATLTARDGRRVTSADVYLDGVDVLAGAEAVAIERSGDRATGVRLADGRRRAGGRGGRRGRHVRDAAAAARLGVHAPRARAAGCATTSGCR